MFGNSKVRADLPMRMGRQRVLAYMVNIEHQGAHRAAADDGAMRTLAVSVARGVLLGMLLPISRLGEFD